MLIDNLSFLIVFLASVAVAAGTGILFQPGAWYAGLRKPTWTPPPLAFPIVWSALYLMMAVAATLVAAQAGTQFALSLWGLQLLLNAVWSPVFFGLHRMRIGLAIIGLLWLAVAATLWAFWAVVPLAGLLMLPYLVWVSIAAALNRAVIVLNPDLAA